MIKYSVLDLATVVQGDQPSDTFKKSADLAREVEQLGYTRFWLAEHHNVANVASSATAVLIGHIAGVTNRIRVGSGGIMLPNHAPLIVAEQFGTLSSLYPGRIDLGVGRAPGTDLLTMLAIRGENFRVEPDFPGDIRRLQLFFSAENSTSPVRAIPGEGLDLPIWVLGSSPESALLAAEMGLPYAFASHFAPRYLKTATPLYRQHFKPSAQLREPYALACVNVIAADSDAEAHRLFTSLQQLFLGIVSGNYKPLQPPLDDMNEVWSNSEKLSAQQMLTYSFVGSPKTLQSSLSSFLQEAGVNEIMATSPIFAHDARLNSYRLFAETIQAINRSVKGSKI